MNTLTEQAATLTSSSLNNTQSGNGQSTVSNNGHRKADNNTNFSPRLDDQTNGKALTRALTFWARSRRMINDVSTFISRSTDL
jgi:hypothetical protein